MTGGDGIHYHISQLTQNINKVPFNCNIKTLINIIPLGNQIALLNKINNLYMCLKGDILGSLSSTQFMLRTE